VQAGGGVIGEAVLKKRTAGDFGCQVRPAEQFVAHVGDGESGERSGGECFGKQQTGVA